MKLLIVGLGSMGKRRARLTKGIDAAIQIVGVDTAEGRRDEALRLGLADAAYATIGEAVAAEHPSALRSALRRATDGVQHIGREDGGILVQREGNAFVERRAQGADRLGALPEIFQVDVSPAPDVRDEEGGDDARAAHVVQPIDGQHLGMDHHGAGLRFPEAQLGVDEGVRRSVSVAVDE